MGYWTTKSKMSDKTLYPSYVRVNPSETRELEAMAIFLAHFNFTIADAIMCDDPQEYERAELIKLTVQSKGITVTPYFFALSEHIATTFDIVLAGRLADEADARRPFVKKVKQSYERAVAGMKNGNAHVHLYLRSGGCATFDIIHYCAFNGLLGRGHFWYGRETPMVSYNSQYLAAARTIAGSLDGIPSPYQYDAAYDGVTFSVGKKPSVDALEPFWKSIRPNATQVFGSLAQRITTAAWESRKDLVELYR
jgi:hypothetical protein